MVELDNVNFHECVQLDKFEQQKMLVLEPPHACGDEELVREPPGHARRAHARAAQSTEGAECGKPTQRARTRGAPACTRRARAHKGREVQGGGLPAATASPHPTVELGTRLEPQPRDASIVSAARVIAARRR
eukprot:3223084-Prymnesium_polylepis.1